MHVEGVRVRVPQRRGGRTAGRITLARHRQGGPRPALGRQGVPLEGGVRPVSEVERAELPGWAARHVGRAPWEPDELTIGAITIRMSTQTRDAWVVRIPLAAIALMLLTGLMFLGLQGLRGVMP